MKKKLTFRAETLRQLSSDELQRANGGTIATPTTILSGEFYTITISAFAIASCLGTCGLLITTNPTLNPNPSRPANTCWAETDGTVDPTEVG